MAVSKDQILASLTALDNEALSAISVACSALLNSRHPDSTPANDPLAWLFEALQATLRVRYGPRWLQTSTGRYFAGTHGGQAAIKVLNDLFPEVMKKKVGAQAMMRWLIEMIVLDLKKKGVSISTGGVVRNLGRARFILMAAFPDYIESGMSSIIADHIINREPKEIL